MEKNRQLKGISLIISAAFCFAGMTTFVRLSGDLPVYEKAFFRNFIAMLIAIFTLAKNRIPLSVSRENVPCVLLRSIFGTIGLVANFYAVDRLNLADANMLNKLSPFFAIIFSYFILGEKVKPTQALAVVGAFVGALFIIKPTGTNLQLFPALIGLLGGICAGAAYTLLRKATQNGTNGTVVVFCFSAFSCITMIPLTLSNFVMPSPYQLLMLLLCGICGAGGQFAITAAYTYAPAREISVYDYSQVIFSAIMGYFLFAQIPDTMSFFGYILIISMAVVNFLYNRRAK